MAAQYNVLVLPTDLYSNAQFYMIYPKIAEMISMEIINYYEKNAKMNSVQLSQVRNYLDKPENSRLKKDVQKMLLDYQGNYTINFNTVQKIASRFKTRHVLLVACNVDTQNYITRRVIWDVLNIPGATVLNPGYRIATNVNLIDANNQIVLWQNVYQKLISLRELRIIPQQLSQSPETLEKIKKYTIKFIAPQIVQETQLALMNISPYQNLNAKPDIVKPQYITVDKLKIDSKRFGIKSAIYTKRGAIKAGKAIKRNAKSYMADKRDRHDAKIAAKEERMLIDSRMTTEDKITLAEYKEQARFKKLQQQQSEKFAKEKQQMEVDNAKIIAQQKYNNELEKQRLALEAENQKLLLQQKFEQQKQKNELNAIKQRAKQESKKEIERQKAELRKQKNELNPRPQKTFVRNNTDDNVEMISDVKKSNAKKESFLDRLKKKNNTKDKKQKELKSKKNKQDKNNEIPTQLQMFPFEENIQQDKNFSPYIRKRVIPEEKEFTINDI